MAATALLSHPEFYKVAVGASGNYDNNIYTQWWGETFHGVKKVIREDGSEAFECKIPTTAELAANLQGNGVYSNGRQTAQAVALTFGIVPATERAAVAARLVEAVEKEQGHVDVGLIGMNADSEALVCQPFCQDRIVLITPVTTRFLALQRLPEVPLGELLSEPIILREEGSGTNKSASHYLESIGIPESKLHITARINDQEAIKNLVAGGLGVSLISEKAAHNFIREKRLLRFDLADSGTRTLYMAWRRNCVLEKHIREFQAFTLEKYRT